VIYDRAQQSVEVCALGSWPEPAGSDALDHAREHVVGALEVSD
jgi:hypothetical protein